MTSLFFTSIRLEHPVVSWRFIQQLWRRQRQQLRQPLHFVVAYPLYYAFEGVGLFPWDRRCHFQGNVEVAVAAAVGVIVGAAAV